MAFTLRPRLRNELSDPLYAATGAPVPGAIQAVPLWLRIVLLLAAIVFGLSYVPGAIGATCRSLRWIVLVVAVLVAVPYLYRVVRHNLLWRLRNKLILTYLLIGLTPIVLFFTLVFVSAYVAAGQFAVHLAAAHLQLQLDNMVVTDTGLAMYVERRVEGGATVDNFLAGQPTNGPRAQQPNGTRQTIVYIDDKEVPFSYLTGRARTPLRMTQWLQKQQAAQTKTFVADAGVLYLTAIERVAAPNNHFVTVISTIPVERSLLDGVASGLGQVSLLPGLALQEEENGKATNAELRRTQLIGGSAPPRVNLLDVGVRFFSTLPVVEWESGTIRPVPLNVESRPSLLYEQLFGAGITGRITDTVRFVFIAICAFFALLEAFAFYMAMRLSKTVTGSVEDLYAATLSIDSGNLEHRIHVQRDDQLADLCRSFNRMSWSLGRLIEEQKEKERMQSELNIAQEVQANLFPLAELRVPTLDLHGICRPARSVSGDYYDFLLFHDDREARRDVTGVGIALGDISGKGISAALLMATLHSAVRAYRFASEELFTDEARSKTRSESLECGELFDSPGRILALLNRHLYLSTQPEKYATLFLAHYEDRTARLTYSNAGQLPPFVLRHDGTVRRLDHGGTVVGLMDHMTYDQETVTLETGDLVIAYSDGVTEPENDFGEFGEDRLLEVIRQHRDEPLAVISAEVMRALDAWIGGAEQPDDITLVLARKV